MIHPRYYGLASSINRPTLQKSWALHANEELQIFTERHAPILRPYAHAIGENLQKLMADCGFKVSVMHLRGTNEDFYAINLRFPERLTNSGSSSSSSRLHNTLLIDDGLAKNMSEKMCKLLTPGPGDATSSANSSGTSDGTKSSNGGSSTQRSESPPGSPPRTDVPAEEWEVVRGRGRGGARADEEDTGGQGEEEGMDLDDEGFKDS